jgi:hypothetical protein
MGSRGVAPEASFQISSGRQVGSGIFRYGWDVFCLRLKLLEFLSPRECDVIKKWLTVCSGTLFGTRTLFTVTSYYLQLIFRRGFDVIIDNNIQSIMDNNINCCCCRRRRSC